MGIGKWVVGGLGIAAVGAVAAYAQYRDSEEPDFALVREDRAFQLRDYPALVVAEVTHSGNRREASGKSFRRLAAYIFAQDRPEGGEPIAMTSPVLQGRAPRDEKIAMTAPVLQDEIAKDRWRMRFVMPAKYTLTTLPPAPEDITLTEIPERRIAAVRFNGYARPAETEAMERELLKWVTAQQLTPVGDFEYAFYDAPMVPGPLRRNEVMIEVEAD
ncbi:heme-binding protein [Erythrobacter sp. JK5]|uniref:SOUL family heme-binding protein n=1 Tax=Erythrobacter sp. JK5 TaxID=2829500 RepID=UPI001BA75E20|nr:heme-binding protein [Erythrobacter sp. JK5]QUL38259.1 heme-binding protein [Erythrobacter sp. JK5]